MRPSDGREITAPLISRARGNSGLLLSDLKSLIDPNLVVLDSLPPDASIQIRDVSIYDPAEPIETGTIVLAVGVDINGVHAHELVRVAAARGAAAVVFRTASPAVVFDEQNISVIRAKPTLTWTQIMALLRALVCLKTTGVDDVAGLRFNTMDGLADVVAAMVGGSVVIYDRAHEVIGYALLSHPIDEARRESICGHRTPQQWMTRFTEDDSAYQTFRQPGTVIHVNGYAGLRTRLRIAVESDGVVLGELSVAEGNSPLDAAAEEALKLAANLASPVLRKYVDTAEGERVRRRRLVLRILHDADAAVQHAPELGLPLRQKWLLVGFRLHPSTNTGEGVRNIINERAVRLVAMQLTFSDASPTVTFDGETLYALLPAVSDRLRGLACSRLQQALAQLSQIGMVGIAAVGLVSNDLRDIPSARTDVDRVLRVGVQQEMRHAVLTVEDSWADLSLLSIHDALGLDIERDCPPLAFLSQYDQEHDSELVLTLEAFLDEFGSVSNVADRLFIHQNTVRHRLQRIIEISGIDLADPTQRLVVSCFLGQLRRVRGTG